MHHPTSDNVRWRSGQTEAVSGGTGWEAQQTRATRPQAQCAPPSIPTRDTSRCLSHYRSIPWCAQLLSRKDLHFTGHVGRSSSEPAYRFWGRTLASPTTIPYFLAFHPPPTTLLDTDLQCPFNPFVPHLRLLLTLGPDLCMHTLSAVSGGAVAAIFDECVCALPVVNMMQGLLPGAPYTKGLRIMYIRPVQTETTVLVDVSLKAVEGRRLRIEAEMSDGEGTLLAKAEGLVLYSKGSRL